MDERKLEVGTVVLCPYDDDYFHGKIQKKYIKKSWFGLRKSEMALVEIHFASRAFWEKEWTKEIRYVDVPIKKLVLL